MSLDAKTYENISKQMKALDENNPEHRDILIKDAIRSMIDKVKRTGTSQDPSECVDDPVYSDPTTHKGYAVIICFYKNKYVGLARQLEPLVTGGYLNNLQSSPKDSAHEAGAEVIKLINLIRAGKNAA